MAKIDSVTTKIIPDSRGEKTLEVTFLFGSILATASVPSGKSKGEHEAVTKPAEESINKIEQLKQELIKMDFSGPSAFDQYLINKDNTPQKSNLGANTMLGMSIAFIRLWAKLHQMELYQVFSQLSGISVVEFPKLFCNLINGGLHVNPKFNPLPFQEYLVIPQTKSPQKALDEVFGYINALKIILGQRNIELQFGDEGGFIVSGHDPEEGLKILKEALSENHTDQSSRLGLDVAASSLWHQNSQEYSWNGMSWTAEQLMDLYQQFFETYQLLSIEDPFNQENWQDFEKLNQQMGDKLWIVGDDLTVTNVQRIEEAKRNNSVNTVIIKPNQIGTVTETINAVKMAKSFGWKTIVSHRSGETMDTFIADLAYGVGADGLKAGCPLQQERLVKYQRLIEIEHSVRG